MSAGRLGPITCVTVRTPSLAVAEEMYGRYLGYRTVSRSVLSPHQEQLWGISGLAGIPTLLMAPEAANDFVFRFVEAPADPGFRAFTRHGWQAAELIVARVDPLANRLADSPFEIVAPPMDLSFCPDIRAMQIRGPGGEILYLTEFKKPVPGLDAPPARCAVDRTFIVIVGGPSLPAMQRYYSEHFGVPEAPGMESRVQTMALAFGLSREHRFRIAALPLRNRCYIEADEMPAEAMPLPVTPRELAPGISMVSFHGAGAVGINSVRGAAGELIEVIAAA